MSLLGELARGTIGCMTADQLLEELSAQRTRTEWEDLALGWSCWPSRSRTTPYDGDPSAEPPPAAAGAS